MLFPRKIGNKLLHSRNSKHSCTFFSTNQKTLRKIDMLFFCSKRMPMFPKLFRRYLFHILDVIALKKYYSSNCLSILSLLILSINPYKSILCTPSALKIYISGLFPLDSGIATSITLFVPISNLNINT